MCRRGSTGERAGDAGTQDRVATAALLGGAVVATAVVAVTVAAAFAGTAGATGGGPATTSAIATAGEDGSIAGEATPETTPAAVARGVQNRTIDGSTNDSTGLRPPTWLRRYDRRSVTVRDATPVPADGTDPGGYVLAGAVGPENDVDGWIARVDRDGRPVRNRTVGTDGNDLLLAAEAVGDGYVLAGTRDAPNQYVAGQFWLLGVDRNGTVDRIGLRADRGEFLALAPAPNGSAALAVGTAPAGSDRAALVAPDGIRWNRSYGRIGLTGAVRAGEGYALVGMATPDPVIDGWALHVGPNGTLRNESTYVREGFSRTDAIARTDWGYVLAGRSGGDWLVGTNRSLAERWRRHRALGGELYAALGRGETALVGGTPGVARVNRTGAVLDRRSYPDTVRGLVGVRGGYLVVGDGFAALVDVVAPRAALSVARSGSGSAGTDGSAGDGAVDDGGDGDPPTVEAGLGVLSAAGSTDDREIAAYRWDLDGDGRVDRVTDDPRVAAPGDPGTREVRVTVVDGSNNTDAAARRVRVVDTTPPRVELVDPDGPVAANRSVELVAAAADAGRVVAYRWDLDGDSTVDRETGTATLTREFSPGEHRVTVAAVDAAGNRNRTTAVVRAVDNAPPELSIDVRDPGGRSEEGSDDGGDAPVRRLNATVVDGTGAVTVNWTLPGGVRATGRTVQYRFPGPGEYVVRATATDEFGASTTATVTVRIDDPEAARATPSTASPTTPTAGPDADRGDGRTTARNGSGGGRRSGTDRERRMPGFGALVALVALAAVVGAGVVGRRRSW